MPGPAYRYGAVIARVVDADTLDARVDLGFRIYAEVPLRLAGVDAPERNTEPGRAASRWVAVWLAARANVVVAETFRAPEKYGRWLAVILDPVSSASLNDELLAAGHAVPWPRAPRDP